MSLNYFISLFRVLKYAIKDNHTLDAWNNTWDNQIKKYHRIGYPGYY